MATRERAALASVVFAVLFAQVLVYPGAADLVEAYGAAAPETASRWFLAAEFGAFVAFAGVWGAASDRAGRRTPFIAAGAAAGSLGYAVLAVAPLGLGGALALRVAQGAATIGAFSLAMTMLMDLSADHGADMGAAGIAIGLGTALGAPVGGQLTELAPRAPLVVGSVALAVAAAVTVRLPDNAPTTTQSRLSAAVLAVRDTPAVLVPYAFGFIDRFTAGFFALVGTLYFQSRFGLDAGATGLTLALFFAPFALLQYPFGRLSDRIGRTIPIAAGSALYGVAVAGVGVAPGLRVAQAGMVTVGVLGALMAPATMALVTDIAPDTERGVHMAGFNIAGSLGFLAGIVGGGWIADRRGFQDAFAIAGGAELVLAAVALPALLALRDRRSE
ncbi:MFS transporter [Halobacterium salinarum]|uniref:MFS transporter n=1 Tax=Halobacterium salinarum TaxID=2242 RepID=UPI001F20639F|nr:MFS transporter [Halobacterium salinarum]MCF2164312.1 MFS transporter [Halobacterium salinarum]MCF2167099.1 MFS transporter [Halobacterium salinarum]MCF2239460.1 MFS transporter [Halobacterium salinarum]WJK63903.1 MFS transporter [Halobacterium salinarum]